MKAELRPSPVRDWPGAATTCSPHCPGGATRTTVVGVRLIGREAEKQALHEVLDSVRRGMSGALVLRGDFQGQRGGDAQNALHGISFRLAGGASAREPVGTNHC